MKSRRLIALVSTVIFGGTTFLRAADDPFAWPPITAQQKPWAFNWWMGSAVDKTNLTHELERYAAAGLGGIHIIPIYGAKGFEDKYINYLSPQWMEMMGWAVSESRRLGIDCDMTTGSGWCFGGPQITDEDANANVVVKTYALGVGERIKEKLNRNSIQALVAYGPNGRVIELTDSITTNGECFFSPPGNWISDGTNSAPPKTWTVYAISQKPSGQKVKRPGPGGEGWMLNLIYPHAMDDFLKPYTAAFANYTGPKPRAQYHDSYEYKSDWSPDFFAQFEKRRGYKLQLELPALFADQSRITNHESVFADHSARVKCDYRQTVSEIMADSLKKWVDWSHERGFITRNQAHGSPGNWLDLYATADIPETEMFHTDRNKLISKFASSAAHVTGKNLVSAETGTWLEEHFTEKLSDVKYLFDDMFLSGINHMFYHGCIYSPDEAPWPGWHFYASLEMNPRNSIWRDAPALNAYAARVQSILQSGQPDNDILLYYNTADFWMQPGDKLLPQLTVHARDWFEGQPIGKTAKELWDKGYSFDYVSDTQLKTAKVVKEIEPGGFEPGLGFPEGRYESSTNYAIQMPGAKYQTIFVPECNYIPLETFQQLLALAENGAMVVFHKQLPTAISGLKDVKARTDTLHELQGKIPFNGGGEFSNGMISNASYGKGQIIIEDISKSPVWGAPIGIGSESGLIRQGLSFVRRSLSNGWVYFIANRTDKRIERCEVGFGRQRGTPVLLNPMTGKSGLGWVFSSASSYFFVPALDPGESILLRVFDRNYFKTNHIQAGSMKYFDIDNPDYKMTGGTSKEITGQWNVKFISGGPSLPADFSTAKLASWTTFPDTSCQAFGGTAKYETTFNADDSKLKTQNSKFFLDLGNVQQSARVRVNDKDYGTLITPPFRVVVDNLKPTGNTLEVEVTSVDANRIRDLDRRGVKWKTFRDINIVNINYKPFDASDWPLTECGLLGPVTLTPVSAEK